MIGGKAPSDYLAQLQAHRSVMLDGDGMDDLLKTHLIDPDALRANDFHRFISARRQRMIDLISKAMGKDPVTTDEAYLDEDDDDEVAVTLSLSTSAPFDSADEDGDDDEDDEADGNPP